MNVIDFIVHLDKHLQSILQHLGPIGSSLLLFGVLFAETGLVVTPFLPGDSLLFVTGALLAKGGIPLSLPVVFVLFSLGAILGDSLNFEIGKHLGRKLFQGKRRFLNPENLQRTEAFFDKYGGKAVIIGRFVPVVRTFAPFVAGMGRMTYPRFLKNNIVGGLLWVSLFLFGGYFFGNLPIVQEHFSYVVVAILILSALPVAYEFIQARRNKPSNPVSA